LEKLEYEDLGGKKTTLDNDQHEGSASADLNLSRVDRYLSGPTAAAALERLNPEEMALAR
jgi:hypothetical protein